MEANLRKCLGLTWESYEEKRFTQSVKNHFTKMDKADTEIHKV
ncbi:hypothetical protein SAMN05443669_100787 [Flavobacterium xanthum]|uniref:Uncharacterized protein n=1 Tax=Flavobacterium xanthum TaxID=69322 RepID=A0A1M7AM52_9FLAO|nr:hypothetical protein SAMN05443669_100787 [Flavobacterium xanthum]